MTSGNSQGTHDPNESVAYFVDEAGDGTLFDRKGGILVGASGCSRYFIVGLLQAQDTRRLHEDLERVRAELLADPYFAGVPSMQRERRKTALAFHAKDDLPEVRRVVFQTLLTHEVSFFAVIRDKAEVLNYVRLRNEREPGYRYHPNHLYDFTVSRLFKDRLHKADQYRITFARRGGSDRSAAFCEAIAIARQRFIEKWGRETHPAIDIHCLTPPRSAGLQAVDYFLWALQRLYERREDRFVRLLWAKIRLVIDVDDTRERRYGRYYTQKNPLTGETLPQEKDRGI